MAIQQKALIVYAPHRGFERRDDVPAKPRENFVEREGGDRRNGPRVDFDPLYELNQLIAKGWRVVMASPMGGGHYHPADQRLTESGLAFASLVILERDEE